MTNEGLDINLHIVGSDWVVFSLGNAWEGRKIAESFLSLRRFWNILWYYFGLMDYFQLLLLLYLLGFFFTFLSARIFCYSNNVSISSEAWSRSYCLTQTLLLFGKSRIWSNGRIRFLFQRFCWLFFKFFILLTWLSSYWISWPYSWFLFILLWRFNWTCLLLPRSDLLPCNLFNCL